MCNINIKYYYYLSSFQCDKLRKIQKFYEKTHLLQDSLILLINVYFQKISIPPPRREFHIGSPPLQIFHFRVVVVPPTPLEISIVVYQPSYPLEIFFIANNKQGVMSELLLGVYAYTCKVKVVDQLKIINWTLFLYTIPSLKHKI